MAVTYNVAVVAKGTITTMEKMYVKIEKYLIKNFPNKKIILNQNLKEGQNEIEFYGINSVPILVSVLDNIVEYKPLF